MDSLAVAARLRGGKRIDEMDSETLAAVASVGLAHLLSLRWSEVRHGYARGELTLDPKHFAPNGYVHAGTIVTLADTACGFACMASRPEGAVSFTTVELKANFLGSAKAGLLRCEAQLVHGGRTTQFWDAEVKRDDGKVIALFRCTQLLIYP